MPTGLDAERVIQMGKEIADMLPAKPVRVTTVKPVNPPLRKLGSVCEGIEPIFSPYLLRHAKARMDKLLSEGDKILDRMTKKEQDDYFNEICEGIGSVATGRDNPPSRRRRIICRSIDDDWEGG
jgi:hypothetical protein